MSDLYSTSYYSNFAWEIRYRWYEGSLPAATVSNLIYEALLNAGPSLVPYTHGDFYNLMQDSKPQRSFSLNGNSATLKILTEPYNNLAVEASYLIQWTPPVFEGTTMVASGFITCTSFYENNTTVSTATPADPEGLINELATPYLAKIVFPENAEETSVFSEPTVAATAEPAKITISPNDMVSQLGVFSTRPSVLYSSRTTVDTDDETADIFDTNRASYVLEMQNAAAAFESLEENVRNDLSQEHQKLEQDVDRFKEFGALIKEFRTNLKNSSAEIKDLAPSVESYFSNSSATYNTNAVFANAVADLNFLTHDFTLGSVQNETGYIGSRSRVLRYAVTDYRFFENALTATEPFLKELSGGDDTIVKEKITGFKQAHHNFSSSTDRNSYKERIENLFVKGDNNGD